MSKLLIVGNLPPPIGGVSIHVSRLLSWLDCNKEIDHGFYDLRNFKIFIFLKIIVQSSIIHLHTSNTIFRFLVVLLCKLTMKKIIITIHGNLGRHSLLLNYIDLISIYFSDIPVLINEESFNQARKYNKKSKYVSAFIAPLKTEALPKRIEGELLKLSNCFNSIFCTNAFNVSFDSSGNEIYQISTLINIFTEFPEYLLIVSDPSGNYYSFIERSGCIISDNIFFISELHDFVTVINHSDCLIRFTTTDGDSLSVREALFKGKSVIASNVVSRPQGVKLVNLSQSDLSKLLREFENNKSTEEVSVANGYEGILEIYKAMS